LPTRVHLGERGSMGKILKVGLVMGGGVSLGAFNGGAIAQIVSQLHSNLNPKVYDRAEIDVLSGASAGGLTLALLLRFLANPESLPVERVVEGVERAQREAWVDKIDIKSLIPEPGEEQGSLLDRGVVDGLAKEFLAWEMGAEKLLPVLLADRVCFAITLLNYNGIPISTSKIATLQDPMSTTLYLDYRYFFLDFGDRNGGKRQDHWSLRYGRDGRKGLCYGRDDLKGVDAWVEIMTTAVAGGAFPLAFEPVVVERRREEYGPLWPDELESRDAFRFSFGDGGTFDNEPLREAARMAAFQDEGEDPNGFDRLLIYVDPVLSGTNHVFSLPFSRKSEIEHSGRKGAKVAPAESGATFLGVAGRLATAVRGQAAYKDFLATEKVNNRLVWRNELQVQLEALVSKVDEGTAGELAAKTKKSLARILNEKGKKPGHVWPDPEVNEEELNRVVERELDRVSARVGESAETGAQGRGSREDLKLALLVLVDHVSDLVSNQEVQIVAIGPDQFQPTNGGDPVPVELAGNFRNNFGGFLLPRFRQHDFQAGRAMAGSALASVKVKGSDRTDCNILKDPDARCNYEAWGGKDPGFEDVPEEGKRLLVRRAGEVARQLARYLFRDKFYRDLSGATVEKIAEWWLNPDALSDRAPANELATLKLIIVPLDPERDEFYLAGQGGGVSTDHSSAVTNGRVELRTLVRYTDVQVTGPHILECDGEWHLELCRHVPMAKDESMFLRLPAPNQLTDGRRMALPVHVAEVNWADRTWGEWTLQEGLEPLTQEMLGTTAESR
jgi:hypothetical protein